MGETHGMKPCPECDGEGETAGYDPGGFRAMFTCRKCDGAGTVKQPAPMPNRDMCPFCKSMDSFVERADLSLAYVVCNNCGARGPVECQEGDDEETPGEAAAIAAWNRRAGCAELVKALEAAAAQFEFYEREHRARAKLEPDTVEGAVRASKAETNGTFARLCRTALTNAKGMKD